MNRLASMLPEYLVVMGLYGVGEPFGPQLMAEIDDVRRSERKQALVAFTGIGPMPNQSRVKNVRSNKSPKRGGAISAQNSVQHYNVPVPDCSAR